MPLQAITSTEPIPGYRICERIGAGGYGEVWKADAPGGLVKAIKFVYGFLSEDRASRELKALNRIKSVRHPFLLSLERIEVVDGQLLIVTELADGSLKDRYDEYLQKKAVGIPWDELIRYMRDAADVLDYMSEEHSLQHLDIKPENLLLLADRVKVADFGLVKDIHDATASMMGGLTPLYAPPEVFDGRPSRWSDQYSLAIVYQEMLTGELPFPGTTAIQLARQHLNARPRLAALPERDQEIVARALSKSPNDRFTNCREFVDALQRAAAANSAQTVSASASGNEPATQKRHTEVLDNAPSSRNWYGDSENTPVPRVHAEPEVSNLAPLELEQQSVCVEPTLYIGVGHTAGRVLSQLRHRLADRFHAVADVPSLQMLLIDTDSRDLLEVSHGRQGFGAHELLGTQLRRPQDYRDDSRQILRWLSRRWLYNIPRSLKTEGLRPLGRLALVDHGETVVRRISRAIETAMSEESRGKSQETAGLEFDSSRMRIIVVASIAGGTGSGMVVDLGYLARHLLAKLGYPDDNVYGVLTHSTGRNPGTSELAVVNTYAALTELNHCGRLGSQYPGEPALDLPPRREDNVAYRDVYLIDLGESLGDEQYDNAADKLAEYLYLDTVTAATQFFSRCRELEPRHADTRNAEISVRSFGLHQYSCIQDDVVSISIEHFCRHAVECWLGGFALAGDHPVLKRTNATLSQEADRTQEAVYAYLRGPVESLIKSMQLDKNALVKDASQMLDHELGQPADEFVREQLDQLLGASPPSSITQLAQCATDVCSRLDKLLGAREADAETGRHDRGTLEDSLSAQRRRVVLDCGQTIREWLVERVECRDDRLRSAQWAAQWISRECRNVEQETRELHACIDRELTLTQQQLDAELAGRGRTKERERPAAIVAALEQLCRLRFYESVASGAIKLAQGMKGQIGTIQEELTDLERELRFLANQFDVSQTLESAAENSSDETAESIGQVLIDNIDQLTNQLEQRFQDEIVKPVGGLRSMLMQAGDKRNNLPHVMRSAARSTLVGIMKQLDASDVLFHAEETPQDEVKTLAQSLQAARPRLLNCGGAKRLLVMLPRGSSQVRPIEILHCDMHETPSVLENCDGDFILCYEAEQISITQAAVSIIDGRCDFAEAASRLHTRNDISWSNLPDLV